jgi:hypothetical protein
MMRCINSFRTISRSGFALVLAVFSILCRSVHACTIFVLTDGDRVLFFNNEDWSNPKTRIWFVPAGTDHYGCVYVGFDDGVAQGGLNTQGLAYDVVAGYKEVMLPEPTLELVRGNPCQRMLETCGTVDDAIAFYRTHRIDISGVKILVADKTGTSVILGAKDGKLQVDKVTQCRGLGYGAQTLEKMLAASAEPTVANGAKILQACLQKGEYATRYSSAFDLKSGDIFLFQFSGQKDPVKLNLVSELKKGGNYYDMPQIIEQLTHKPNGLLSNMKRFPLDGVRPIPDKEPRVTEHLRAMFLDVINGTMKAVDFTEESWKQVSPTQKDLQAYFKSLGEFAALTLVGCSNEDGQRHYRYKVEFQNATLLYHFILDEQNRHAFGSSEDLEPRSSTDAGVH